MLPSCKTNLRKKSFHREAIEKEVSWLPDLNEILWVVKNKVDLLSATIKVSLWTSCFRRYTDANFQHFLKTFIASNPYISKRKKEPWTFVVEKFAYIAWDKI